MTAPGLGGRRMVHNAMWELTDAASPTGLAHHVRGDRQGRAGLRCRSVRIHTSRGSCAAISGAIFSACRRAPRRWDARRPRRSDPACRRTTARRSDRSTLPDRPGLAVQHVTNLKNVRGRPPSARRPMTRSRADGATARAKRSSRTPSRRAPGIDALVVARSEEQHQRVIGPDDAGVKSRKTLPRFPRTPYPRSALGGDVRVI